MDFAVEEMRRQGHEVDVFYYENEPLNFKYSNALHKITAGSGKLIGRNAKHISREKALKRELKNKTYDFNLIIHGQYLNKQTHKFLKSISKRHVAYFFDSLTKMPEQKKTVPYYDKIFSYEPQDCRSEEFEFITNFIPSTDYKSDNYDYKVFNIGGRDDRFPYIKKLGEYLKTKGFSYRFMLFDKKPESGFENIQSKMNVHQVLPLIRKCKIMLDMQRTVQCGLTFRVFEALGNDKKLITTNKDIVNYPFYDPKNIYLLNPEQIMIPDDFFEKPYVPLDEDKITPYTVESWVKKILAG